MSQPKSSTRPADRPGARDRSTAETPRSVLESAQQIWLAGIGAFSRAQEEGGKMFEALVREGSAVEERGRSFASESAGAARSAVESQMHQVRGYATEAWERMERTYDDRLRKTFKRLGFPDRDEIERLRAEIAKLNAELGRHRAPAKASPARRPGPAAKSAAGGRAGKTGKSGKAAKKSGTRSRTAGASTPARSRTQSVKAAATKTPGMTKR